MTADRTLVVLRHAKSDWTTGTADHDRPLNERGRRNAVALGHWLAEHVGRPDLVVCSTATRARQTWRLAGPAVGPVPVRPERRVYAATADGLRSVLDELADELGTVALVGHNPGLAELVETLTGERVELRTASVAVLGWSGSWADVWGQRASLATHATPR